VGNYVKIQSHTFICSGVTIEDEVFIGHGVMFVNDKYPQAVNKGWTMQKTIVKKGASLGSNCTILGGVIIGEGAVVGAGAVVTKDVPNNAIVVGNPAHIIRSIKS
jgi:acetyltransferase-like isoleucine patch superfamily enzyme